MDNSKISEDLRNSTEALSYDDDGSHSSKWTPFEDSEDYPSDSNSNDSNEEDNADGLTQRHHSADHPHVTSDPETRNLLDDAEDNIDGDDDDNKIIDEKIKHRELEIDDDVFKISQYQKEYYIHCFVHLQKMTQGTAYLNGAVNGADERVVEFFRKSDLNTAQLSRIWNLSDVNEDGWLNLAEFSVAMHLIVLRTKGGVPIPHELPPFFKPPTTPIRNASSSHGSTACSTISSSSSRESDYYQQAATVQKSIVPTLNGTLAQEPNNPVAEFSDVPPLLVDNRPTAVKNLVTTVGDGKFPLSPQARGPPPKPPPRDYRNRGHGRSASLDLNTVFQQGQANSIHISSTSICGCQGEFHTCIPLVPPGSAVKTSCPTIYAPNFVHITSSTSPQPVQTPVNMANFAQKQAINLSHTGIQTDPILWMNDLNEDLDLLLDKTSRPDSTGKENTNWQTRCEVLRKLNSELESKRVMLSQIRLQLQLRISEIEEANKSAQPSSGSGPRVQHGGVTKPTSL